MFKPVDEFGEGVMSRKIGGTPLTPSQLTVMKCIWDAKEELSYQELIADLENRYGKEYQRSTVITFLRQLTDKGMVETYRKGRKAYVRALLLKEEFQQEQARSVTNHWYEGKVSNFLSAFVSSGGIADEDVAEIRRLLDELDQ